MLFRKKRPSRSSSGTPPPLATHSRSRRPGQAALYDRIIERVRAAPQIQHVVDLGCGSGVLDLRLAEALSDIRITGLDASSDLIRLATRTSHEAGLGQRLVFRRADLSSLPLSDACAELLVGAGVLAETMSPQVLLGEIFRVLVPGASALLMEVAEAEAEAESVALGQTLSETRLRRLLERSSFGNSFQISPQESDGESLFLELTLTRPIPETRFSRR